MKTEKRAYAVVDVYGFLGVPGDGLKAAIAAAGFAPGDQVEIRPRVAPGEQLCKADRDLLEAARIYRAGIDDEASTPAMLQNLAKHVATMARVKPPIFKSDRERNEDLLPYDAEPLAAAPEEQEAPLGTCDSGKEEGSQAGERHRHYGEHARLTSCSAWTLANAPSDPRPALPEEVVCDSDPLPHSPAKDDETPCANPRPAHPPEQKQLGEEGGEAPSGETFPQWKTRIETLERGQAAAMGRAQRATEERDAAVDRANGMERAAEQWKKSAFRMQELLTLLQADPPPDETSTLAKLLAAESALFESEGANILNRAALKGALGEREHWHSEYKEMVRGILVHCDETTKSKILGFTITGSAVFEYESEVGQRSPPAEDSGDTFPRAAAFCEKWNFGNPRILGSARRCGQPMPCAKHAERGISC